MSSKDPSAGPFAFFFTYPGRDDAREESSLDEAFLDALKAADPERKSSMRIYRGGLLLASGARKVESISAEKRSSSARQTTIRGAQSYTLATDDTLYGFRLGDFAETALERWNTFDRATLWDYLANRC